MREVYGGGKINGMRRKVETIHFVGIGGIGMSGIAEVLLNLGYKVTGSDLGVTDITQRLRDLGAVVYHGHRAEQVGRADVVVTSTAVRKDNPEVLEAHRRGIPVIPRAEMLAELLKMKFSIAVSGSHGKTTTTSMIATVLAAGGLDPTMVIGGKLGSIGSNAKMGDGEIIVAEADESDGSFLKLGPTMAVITNIDREHLDHYRDIDEIKEAFLKFANIVPFYGCTVACVDDPHVREILPEVKRRVITYAVDREADYRASGVRLRGRSSSFHVLRRGEDLGEVVLNVPGACNVANAMAAVAVAMEIDMDFDAVREGIGRFSGVHRRLETKGEVGGVTVVDDYGHHPTEIRETLAAARQLWDGRLIVVFQPHRYTRTKALFDEFTTAFPAADVLIVTEIYAASEEPIEGVSGEALARAMARKGGEVVYVKDMEEVVERLMVVARPGDVIVTQGAGSVWKVGEAFLERYRGKGN